MKSSDNLSKADSSDLSSYYEIPGNVGSQAFTFKMLQMNDNDQVVRTAHYQGWHKFEEPLPQVFAYCVKNNPGIIIDVGANTGFYSIISAVIDCNNTVYSFEPYEPIYDILLKNVELNGLSRRIKPQLIALSDERGYANFFIPVPTCHLLETSASLDFFFKEKHDQTISVETSRIDDYLDEFDGKVTVIKIDVEGHEKHVIEGARQTICNSRPFLFIEILDRADLNYFTKFISTFEYTDIRLRPDDAIGSEQVVFDMQAWNHVLVPNEKLTTFLHILDASNLGYISKLPERL